MGPKSWAAIGNVLRLFAVLSYLAGGVFGYQTIELNQRAASSNLVQLSLALTVFSFVVATFFWNAKGPLVSGNLIVQALVGLYMLLWIVSTLGFALIVIAIVYLFTGQPADYEIYKQRRPDKPRFKPSAGWSASGTVGPSGATLYAGPSRDSASTLFDSWTPVQVKDRRNGYTRVIAASGESGWIDDRTLLEST